MSQVISRGCAARSASEPKPSRSAAPGWSVPTLLLYAGADRLVRPDGSRAFAAAAPRNMVTSQCLEGQFHEIFNEADPSAAYAALKAWLDGFAPA